MSFEIGATEHPGRAIRRIAGEQLGRAIAEIRRGDASVEWRIHQLRKRCKKIRAALRLIRPGFACYRQENRRFRAIAHCVSAHRDARVLSDLARELCEKGGLATDNGHPAERWYRIRCQLAEEHGHRLLPELERKLADAATEVEVWPVESIDIEAAIAGARRTLKRAHKNYRKAEPHAPAGVLHEWRKRTKYHRLHVRLLGGVSPAGTTERYREFKSLDGLIGDEHDCSVLIRSLRLAPEFVCERSEARELLALALRRRRKLRRRALDEASALFDEPVNRFCESVEDCWNAQADAAC